MALVLGLTGSNASGKGEVAAYLQSKGFAAHSLSDIVREQAARRGLRPERENLIRVGNELRDQGGPGVLAERILPRLGEWDVVDSIRNPSEVEALRRLPHFLLVGIRAPVEVRFRRSVERARPGDPRTIEEFEHREAEENTELAHAQRLDATFRLADRTIDNDGDLAHLHQRIERLVEALTAPRPD